MKSTPCGECGTTMLTVGPHLRFCAKRSCSMYEQAVDDRDPVETHATTDPRCTCLGQEPAPASRAVVVSALRREILLGLHMGASKGTRYAAREHLAMLCTLAENAQ